MKAVYLITGQYFPDDEYSRAYQRKHIPLMSLKAHLNLTFEFKLPITLFI